MTEEEEERRDLAVVDRALAIVKQHFDNVMIFANRLDITDGASSVNVQKGLGNYYARYGHCRAWVMKQDESFKSDEKSDFPEF
jgi:hypothetical protein